MTDPQFLPLIVVPTRNRSSLAAAAMRSVLVEPSAQLRLWVSDNSTDGGERDKLKQHCATLNDPRLRYITPPEPASMGRHWEWIVGQILADERITHVGFLSDRMLYIPGALRHLLTLAQKYPQSLIGCTNDHLDDLDQPVHLIQNEWTGRALEINSAVFIRQLLKVGWDPAFPRMINSLVPTRLFRQLREVYGTVLESISPDVCFGFRALEQIDSFIYLDRSLMLDYALSRSNGHSNTRGQATRDAKDFMSQLDQRGMNYASPVPGLTGPANALFHEYNLVREASKNPKYGPINLGEYFTLIQRDLRKLVDPDEIATQEARAAESRTRLLASGEFGKSDLLKANIQRVIALEKIAPPYLALKLVKSLSRLMPAWNSLWRQLEAWLGRAGAFAAAKRVTEWPSAAEALRFAATHPLPRSTGRSVYEYKVGARQVESSTDA